MMMFIWLGMVETAMERMWEHVHDMERLYMGAVGL